MRQQTKKEQHTAAKIILIILKRFIREYNLIVHSLEQGPIEFLQTANNDQGLHFRNRDELEYADGLRVGEDAVTLLLLLLEHLGDVFLVLLFLLRGVVILDTLAEEVFFDLIIKNTNQIWAQHHLLHFGQVEIWRKIYRLLVNDEVWIEWVHRRENILQKAEKNHQSEDVPVV